MKTSSERASTGRQRGAEQNPTDRGRALRDATRPVTNKPTPAFVFPGLASLASVHFEREDVYRASAFAANGARTRSNKPNAPNTPNAALPVDHFNTMGEAKIAARAEAQHVCFLRQACPWR